MDLQISKALEPLQGCHPSVADGIKHFAAEIELQQSQNTRAFSLGSRNSSISSLLQKHLDIPIDDVRKNYRGTYLTELLDDFQLSRVGQVPPKQCIDISAWSKEKDGQIYTLEECLTPLAPSKTIEWKKLLRPVKQKPHDKHASNIRRTTQNIRIWERNLRFVILSMDCSNNDCVSNKEHLQFRKTIGSIQTLLSTLELFLPQTGKDPALQLYDGPPHIGIDHHDDFCELCWRKTMRAVELNRIYNSGVNIRHLESTYSLLQEGRDAGFIANELNLSTEIVNRNIETIGEILEARGIPPNNESKKIKRFSNIYCHEHNPADPTSRYRSDYGYKEEFRQELALRRAKFSRFVFPFMPPSGANLGDLQELRKTVYDQVHSGIPLHSQYGSQSLLEKILELRKQGMTQTEIAKKLGVHKQAVNREITKINKLLQIRQQEQYVNPITEESWEKSKNSPLVQQVLNLHKKGYTVADIAKETNRFKHTIHSVYFWLRLKPNKRGSKIIYIH